MGAPNKSQTVVVTEPLAFTYDNPPAPNPDEIRLAAGGSGLIVSNYGAPYEDIGAGAGGPPTGAAGGALSGTYPNPTLANVGPGATGPLGDATHVGVVTINAEGQVTAFTSTPIAKDIEAFFAGVPGVSQVGLVFVAARAITLPINLTGSKAAALVAATAQTDFDIQVNGVSKGTVSFAIAATTATFTFAAAVTLAIGDVLQIIAPGVPDATLANVGITLKGTY